MPLLVLVLYMIMFFSFVFVDVSTENVATSQTRDYLLALDTAAAAGLTMRDSDATAEAGLIILDEQRAIDAASEWFASQVKHNYDLNEFSIEIVNNAPITKVVKGEAVHFQGNGIIIRYMDLYQVREIDDR